MGRLIEGIGRCMLRRWSTGFFSVLVIYVWYISVHGVWDEGQSSLLNSSFCRRYGLQSYLNTP